MELNPGGIKPVVGNTGFEVLGDIARGITGAVQKGIKARGKARMAKTNVGGGMTQAEKLELIDKVTEASEKLDAGTHKRTLQAKRLEHKQGLEKAAAEAELAKDASFHHLFLSTEFADHVKPGSSVTFKGPQHEVSFTAPKKPRQPKVY